jgi:hypothetical protein
MTQPNYYITYGLAMIGGDAINNYSIWEERPGYGFRPICSYTSLEEAIDRIPHWRAAIERNPQINEQTRWLQVACAKGRRIVYP